MLTLERVGTLVGSNSSQLLGSIGTHTRPGNMEWNYSPVT